eukprot:6805482-Prymnesium_polylepis.1
MRPGRLLWSATSPPLLPDCGGVTNFIQRRNQRPCPAHPCPCRYVASCRRAPELQHLPTATLEQLHESLTCHPLQIAPDVATVDTILRSAPSGETATPAQYSIYSSLAPQGPTWSGMGGGAPAGGGAPNAATTATHGAAAVQIDWAVAYYNVLDMCRDACAELRRRTHGAESALWRGVAALQGWGTARPVAGLLLAGIVAAATATAAAAVGRPGLPARPSS